jgi:twinkle protein
MPKQELDSEFIEHIACPACGSSDANALYDDAHTHCFACGKTTFGDADKPSPDPRRRVVAEFITGEVRELPVRHLSEETCRKFGYSVGKNHADITVQIADYRDADGTLIAQKLRKADKSFSIVGEGKNMPLFGMNLWPTSGKRVVVTEGEIDAMSCSQAQGNKWPVVSVPNGAQGAAKAFANNIKWLRGYDEVVIMFDMDEPGRDASVECARLLPPGRAKIAELPMKDANELLKVGRSDEIRRAMYDARVYRPDGIVTLADIRSRVMTQVTAGFEWPWSSLTRATYGMKLGEVIGIGAGTGVGKSEAVNEIIIHFLHQGVKVGVIKLEEDVGETGRRLASKLARRQFYTADGSWVPADLEAAYDVLEKQGGVVLYDSFGATDWDGLQGQIEYMALSEGCTMVALDHLTALAAAEDDERKALEKIMAEMSSLAKRLNIILIFVSHLATPDGTPHEENGRVTIKNFKGSRSIGFWSHTLLGLERHQQHDDPEERRVTTIRVLKHRAFGSATGFTMTVKYNLETGMLDEFERPPVDHSAAFAEEEDAPF